MSESTFDVDLNTFSRVRPLTTDDLRRFSAADLDPHTVQVGQILCKDFRFSSQGQRNLASAFDALPSNINQPGFECGFGNHHVVHTILKSDEGFQLCAVVGALGEYFSGGVIVEFFLQLTLKMGVPIDWQPLEHQWRRMVEVLCGVLASSPFGTVLSSVEDACLMDGDTSSDLDISRLLDNVLRLKGSQAQPMKKLLAGTEAIWLAAISEWLFSLKPAIISGTGTLLYTSQASHGAEDADIVIVLLQPSPEERLKSLSLSERPLDDTVVLGGRVSFEHLFRSCFHQAFTNLSDDLIAALIYTASGLVKQRLNSERPGWAFEILSQSNASGEQTVGLADTLTAWFPELRRLTPRFRKYVKLNDEELRSTFDRTYRDIQRTCTCTHCIDLKQRDAPYTHPERCSVIVAEFIVRLSFVLARMLVTPKLLPKRRGIVSFLRWYRQDSAQPQRKALLEEQKRPSDDFQDAVVKMWSSSVGMIKSAALIFANSSSPEIEAEENLMGISHSGITIFSTGAKDMVGIEVEQVKAQQQKLKSAIQVTPGWLCLSGHEARLEVYVDLPGAFAYDDLRSLRTDADFAQVRQMLRWSGRKMCTSIVHRGSEAEKKALRDGWGSDT